MVTMSDNSKFKFQINIAGESCDTPDINVQEFTEKILPLFNDKIKILVVNVDINQKQLYELPLRRNRDQ